MILKYAREHLGKEMGTKSIFLAGPTPRSQDVLSWRPKALEILKELGFEGTVYIPEDRDGKAKFDYLDQVEWEKEGLTEADVILFWIPRELTDMPGFTTNVEFGYWIRSGKVIYGRPNEARKNKYLDWLYRSESKEEPIDNLEKLIARSLEKL